MTVTPAKVVSYYVNLIDEQIDQLGHHLADNVILYWYGRTVRGKALVLSFLSDEIASPEHIITSAQAIPEIHYREVSSLSRACTTKPTEEGCAPDTAECVGLLDSGCESLPSEDDFPDRKHKKSGLQHLDCSLVQNTPDIKMSECERNALLRKPKKRKFTPHPSLSNFMEDCYTSFLEAKGTISFRRVGRYGMSRSWHRECTLQLAYSCPPFGAGSVSCSQFSVIIYSDEMKCRRNLAKVFEQLNLDKGNLNNEDHT